MEYNFAEIEKNWKKYWNDQQVYKVSNDSDKPKCYILDMFPYPSGAGLHVGHPLGYIASDIYARYKRLKGYNVLHPMGFDAFGLPAEQYALETGQHPAVTTEKNIARYREQLDNIGFCYDWDRQVRTSDAKYYKWTQWIFLQLFHSWYDRVANKARPVTELVGIFEQEGNAGIPCPGNESTTFTGEHWSNYSEKEQRDILMQYRLAYQGYAQVWWCEALGTVLANDEVVNGVSERGSHPVERKNMRQWFLRITEYADRLITSLDNLEWSDAMKEMQRNWIGKSVGAEVRFGLAGGKDSIAVFTTRPDTIFGVDFMVLAPEHELVDTIPTEEQKKAIDEYRTYVKSRSERERMSEVKQVTGCFTGAYAEHPFTGRPIPVWISEYVLVGYGTGAIMAVPSGDDRDHAFAKHFNIPITNIFGEQYNGAEAYAAKTGTIQNSDFLTGMSVAEASDAAINELVAMGEGTRKINYRLRDAGFSRQRYWGEPFPIIYVDDIPYGNDEHIISNDHLLAQLPVELPMVEHYKPGPEGQGPLANIEEWVETSAGERETNTMPGYAGSSWYFLRYMDPHNDTEFASRKATDYWNQVDLYIGGTEHAVGHLLYSRMWTKALCDLGHIGFDEPFKKLLNQGMIQGSSRFAYRVNGKNKFVSYGFKKQYDTVDLRVDVTKVDGLELDIDAFKKWRSEYADAEFILEDGKYICGAEVEKMSKSKYNVVNPDDIVAQYGADTFRMYEMFLGPIDVSKPWDTKGIEGVHRFLKKMWRLYNDEQKGWIVTDEAATDEELRILHKTIKKIGEDIERFAFNTSVSQFMICVNELSSLNCHKRAILEPLAVTICAFAPHIAEQLWHQLGHETSVINADFPAYDEQYTTENTKQYPVAINGKTKMEMAFHLDTDPAIIEQEVLADAAIQKWMEGKPLKKFIYVRGKMINVVV
jgi:leucyl-tRNA synthetase